MTQLEQAMANVDEQMKELVRTERPKLLTRQASEIISERAPTHGDYTDTAAISQGIKLVMHSSPNWSKLTPAQKETLEMLATKLARILVGNPNEPDHWRDITGYATLVVERLG